MTEASLKAGVIGWPIDHSFSPHLHGFWLNHYNINGEYLPFAVEPENRLVARNLERDWNEKLAQVERLEREYLTHSQPTNSRSPAADIPPQPRHLG